HTRCYRDWSSDVCSSDLPRDQEGQRKVRDDRIASYYCFLVAGDCKLWWHVRPNLHGNRQELLVDCERITGKQDVIPGEKFALPRSEERRVGKEGMCQRVW